MNTIYRLGEYEVDSLSRQLRLNGEVVALAQKPFDVLLYLIGRAGQVVTKDELMEAIWPGSFVEESNLTQSIFLLRKAFSDKASGSRYIITVAGRGYQLGVSPIPIAESAPPPEPTLPVPAAPLPVVEPETKPAPPPLSATPPVPPPIPTVAPPSHHFRSTALLIVGVIALAVSFAAWKFWHDRHEQTKAFTLKRLTNSGDVQVTAISSSGTYAAFVTKSALGSESISVYDLRSGTSRVIVHNDADLIDDMTFSPGDLYLYYRSHAKADTDDISSEHRVPLLGGEPIVVVRDIDGPITFLKDGTRFCFWRGSAGEHFSVISASTENSKEEKILVQSERPLPISLVCAPDGEKAAISTEIGGISILDFKTGSRQPFYKSDQEKEIYQDLQWKQDGSELIGTVFTPSSPAHSLISISYPQAIRTQITHDIDSYRSSGMTADGTTLIARQGESNAQFQSFDLPLLALNPEVISFPWTGFVGWRDEDKIVGSAADGGIKIKEIAAGQENSLQTPTGMHFLQPNGCGPNALVTSGTSSAHAGNASAGSSQEAISIWHMDADGSRLEQLTHGPEDILPACTPDGKWVLYADNSFRGKAAIYRISAEGGSPEKVGEGSVWFAISHKGDKVAWVNNERGGQANERGSQTLVLADLLSGRHLASIPIPPQLQTARSLSFSPEDQQVFLISRGEPSDSLYEMPLNQTRATGSTPVKQIEFRGAHVAAIAVSPAGKYLGVVTVKPVSDVVLLQRSLP